MRKLFAACVCALALGAPGVSSAQSEEGWRYEFTADGVATATQRDERGRVTATITCRPPEGDIVISDFTFGRQGRRASTAAVGIGQLTVNVPAATSGRGRNQAVTINLPQRPPILAGVQPNDRLSVTVNGRTNTYLAGSAQKMREVAFACWGS
ncbi:MAG TPA: hypothetical protein VEA80_01380 [Vitreimonas sp.]|uniref:hypothetical protein n=1 Tax=Vitreimonas sp. TaxID=3069702 RepID=UPI002D5D3DD4|nr:hypothetical protein [Vitreimonas sp.]HYD86103.1 hypothetical protein [Vitreimonas sp.]